MGNLPTPAELAEPTPGDIAQRLADDARALAGRINNFAGPLDTDLEEDLDRLGRSIRNVLEHGR